MRLAITSITEFFSSRWRSFKTLLLRLTHAHVAVTAIVAFAALGLSAYNTYVQSWPRHRVTATIVSMSANPVGDSGGAQVRVELALWNRGNRPAVISDGHLVFDVCPDFRSPILRFTESRLTPFVIAPGVVVLKTLTDDYPTKSLLTHGLDLNDRYKSVPGIYQPKCSARVRAPKGTLYVGVFIEAIQSDRRPGASWGLGGLVQGPMHDKGASAIYGYFRKAHVPVGPFDVVPAQRAEPTGTYMYWQK